MIRLERVNKFYNKGRSNEIHVINNVSLSLPEKGMVAIFGRSGCGKTTLLNVIGGQDGFHSGTVEVEGTPMGKNADVLRNQSMGYIFQNYNLQKEKTCFDNVADALRLCGVTDRAVIRDRVLAALACVGMDKYQNRLPDNLSGGQQQRIAIARAIVKNPRIILADEPTGNLDEQNTLLVMDLLRRIAEDHLVLLVTHEANLVDYYCDLVVEMSDGQVIGQRENLGANGLETRNKNDIYLGEHERTELQGEGVLVEYYGQKPENPLRLRVVNVGGKIYLQSETPGVQFLDATSETRLKEGTFAPRGNRETSREQVDMSGLPPIQGKHYGRLFRFWDSVKSGYLSNFRGKKRGIKSLRACMALFAAVLVVMTAFFGTGVKSLGQVEDSYHSRVFYVDAEVASPAALRNAVGKGDSGISYMRLEQDMQYRDPAGWNLVFQPGYFETFDAYMDLGQDFSATAVFLDGTLAKEKPLVAGRREIQAENEMVITSAMAKALLEKSILEYLEEPEDLVGLLCTSFYVGNGATRIVGVVEDPDSAVYLHPLTMARQALATQKLFISPGSDYGFTVAPGKTVLLSQYQKEDLPKAGEEILIGGKRLLLEKVVTCYWDFEEFLMQKGGFTDQESFLQDLVLKENPTLGQEDEEYWTKLEELRQNRFWEFHLAREKYFKEFAQQKALFYHDFDVWFALEKEDRYALYSLDGQWGGERFLLEEYKAKHGAYPTLEEYWEFTGTYTGQLWEYMAKMEKQYRTEFINSKRETVQERSYLLSPEDYVSLASGVGESHKSVNRNALFQNGSKLDDGFVGGSKDQMYSPEESRIFLLLYSDAPEKTAAYLSSQFPKLSVSGNAPTLYTPDSVREGLLYSVRADILQQAVSFLVVLALLSVCMYFIMRSSLLRRIREVGIYRAIGVSKKNLLFRFFIESCVLVGLTVLVGFLLVSAVMVRLSSASTFGIIYYPIWMAAALGGLLLVICLLCGILPIAMLLRRSPSAILAKYDI